MARKKPNQWQKSFKNSPRSSNTQERELGVWVNEDGNVEPLGEDWKTIGKEGVAVDEGKDVALGTGVTLSSPSANNLTVTASGTTTVNGALTVQGTFQPDNIAVDNGGNIGSAGDADAMSIAADGQVTFSQNQNHSGQQIVNSQTVNDLQSGASYRFDGSNDVVTIADSDNLSFGDGVSDSAFSITAWINMRDATNFEIAAKGVYNTNPEWHFYFDGSDQLRIGILDSSTGPDDAYHDIYTAALTSLESEWAHVAATYNGVGGTSADEGLALYVNGVLQAVSSSGSGTYVAMENLGASVTIANNGSSTYAEGEIRQLRIHNRALTADEVRASYNGQAVGYEHTGASQTELVVNGTFEGTYSSGLAPSWTKEQSSTTLTELTSGAYSGSSQGISGFQYGGVKSTASVVLVAGQKYRFSVQVKSSANTIPVNANVYGSGNAGSGDQSFTATTSWQEFTFDFIPTVTSATIYLRHYGTSDTLYVDAASLKRIGCVAEYLPESISSSSWLDSSGNKLNGSVSGATATNADNNVPVQDGHLMASKSVADVQSGASYRFDGGDDWVVVPNDANLNFGTGDFSAELWFKRNASESYAGDPEVLLNNAGASQSQQWQLSINSSNGIYPYLTDGSNTFDGRTGGVAATGYDDGDWHHVCLSYDRGSTTGVQLFIDGVLKASGNGTSVGNLTTADDFRVGGYYTATYDFKGEIRQVRIHNRALTAAEVRASYNGQSVGYEYTGASQTELVTGDDSDFDSVGNWTGGYIGVSGGVATFTNLTSSLTDFTALSSLPLTLTKGKTYRFTGTITSVTGSWALCYSTGVSPMGIVSQSSSNTGNIDFEWTVSGDYANYIYMKSGSGTSTFSLDNFTVQQIGCVAEYLPESISNQSWLDSSGNALNGSVSGATATNADNNVPVQDGHLVESKSVADLQSGASFKFDGSDDRVTNTANSVTSSADVTASAWIKTTKSTGDMMVLGLGNAHSTSGIDWYLRVNEGVFDVLAYRYSGYLPVASSGVSVADGEWHHLVMVITDRVGASTSYGSKVEFYVDGVLASSVGPGDSTTTGMRNFKSDAASIVGDLWIGSSIDADYFHFDGEIRQARVHNRALSADEVRAAYSGQAVSYEYVGASQSEMLTDGGLEAWTGDALDSWTEVETGSSTITNDQANERSGSNSAKFTLDSSGSVMMMKQNVSFVEGKRYRLSLWAKGATGSGEGFYIRTDATIWPYGGDTGTLGGGGATASWQQNTINNSISGSWTEYVWEFVAASTDNAFVLLRSGDNSTSFYVDDLSVKRLGCVAEYLPTGINSTQWVDTSGNGLTGTTSTATAVNHEVGSLTMVDNIVMANGKGIDFSATSDATGKTGEVLDDYEEGAWTPVLTSNTGSDGALSHVAQRGTYTKIGRMVTLQCYMSIDNKGSRTGVAMIGGLPYTVGIASPMDSFNMAVGPLWLGEVDLGSSTQIVVTARRGETTVSFSKSNDDGAITEVQISELEATAQFIFTLSYLVD